MLLKKSLYSVQQQLNVLEKYFLFTGTNTASRISSLHSRVFPACTAEGTEASRVQSQTGKYTNTRGGEGRAEQKVSRQLEILRTKTHSWAEPRGGPPSCRLVRALKLSHTDEGPWEVTLRRCRPPRGGRTVLGGGGTLLAWAYSERACKEGTLAAECRWEEVRPPAHSVGREGSDTRRNNSKERPERGSGRVRLVKHTLTAQAAAL